MSAREPSKTAMGVAVLRAVHQLVDAAPKILEDPIAAQLLDPSVLAAIHTDPARFQTPPSIALRAHVVIRSRYAEDRLAAAVERGVQQMISLGAGYDTFPYRQPEWAHALRIFEVDQPASQQEKRDRLQTAGIVIPSNVELVPIDFETTSIEDGLRTSSFDFSRPTFLSWLGVMVYLSQEAIDAVFKFVMSLPPTSEIVFTFSPPQPTEQEPNHKYSSLAARAAELGEPWKSNIAPDELVEYLRALGFTAITIPTPAEIDAWYIQGRQDGLHASRRRNIASAIV